MSFENFKTEDARLTILRLLADQNDYALNEYVLQTGLKALAHTFSRDRMRSELAWLKEQQLISIEEAMDGVQVAKLLNRGHDVANGSAMVPGVKRPSPGDR